MSAAAEFLDEIQNKQQGDSEWPNHSLSGQKEQGSAQYQTNDQPAGYSTDENFHGGRVYAGSQVDQVLVGKELILSIVTAARFADRNDAYRA